MKTFKAKIMNPWLNLLIFIQVCKYVYFVNNVYIHIINRSLEMVAKRMVYAE
jgi:hypothetical protein